MNVNQHLTPHEKDYLFTLYLERAIASAGLLKLRNKIKVEVEEQNFYNVCFFLQSNNALLIQEMTFSKDDEG